MPIDYQQIYAKIQEIGKGARERKRTLEERRSKARELLDAYSSELDALRSKVDSAKAIDQNIRCALPLDEPLASSYPLLIQLSKQLLSPLTDRRSTRIVMVRSSFRWSMSARSQ